VFNWGTLAFEAAGPLLDAPSRTMGRAVTQAVREAARLLDRRGGAPTLVRADPSVAKVIAGVVRDVPHYRRHEWKEMGRHRRLWLGSAAPFRGNPWADRARYLAARCATRVRHGEVGPALAGLDAAALPDADACCICMEDFADVLPSGDAQSRSVEGLYNCTHAVCRSCDGTQLQRCPLCRADRVRWIPRRP
jgi:hypothetical protein